MVDITPFVERARNHLLWAIEQSGVSLKDCKEEAPKKFPFGRWHAPVILLAYDTPIAKYWLTYPRTAEGKTVKFNVETTPQVQTWLQRPMPPLPSPENASTMTDAPSSS